MRAERDRAPEGPPRRASPHRQEGDSPGGREAILAAQRSVGNRAVARVLEGGTVAATGPQVTVNPIERANPTLFVRMEDLGKDDPALVVDDSVADVAEFGGQEYLKIAQMCSIMSVYWIQNRNRRLLRLLEPGMQRETAKIVYANQTPDAQFDYARSLLGFEEKTVDFVEGLAANRPQGTKKVLLYSAIHVSAALISAERIVYFDPETGEDEEVSPAVFSHYLDRAARALVG